MTNVRRNRNGIVLALSTADRTILLLLAQQVAALLEPDAADVAAEGSLEEMVGMSDHPIEAPDDPALHRLLPDAYQADDEAAAEFRRLMDGDLRRQKVEALQQVITDASALDEANGSVELDPDGAEVWLQALNDIRLVLGVRLDVTEDLADVVADIAADDPRMPLLLAYDRLTALQDALITAIDQ